MLWVVRTGGKPITQQLAEFEQLRRMECDSDLALGSLAHVLALSGDRIAAESILSELLEMAQRNMFRLTALPLSI